MTRSKTGAEENTSADRRIAACDFCQSKISLCWPSRDRPAGLWRCRSCRSLYLARANERDGSIFRGGVSEASDADPFGREFLRFPPQVATISNADLMVLNHVSNPVADDGSGDRRVTRHSLRVPITIVPLTDNLRIAGPASPAYTIDLSRSGISLIHRSPIADSLLAVDFAPAGLPTISVILQALRCSRVGEGYTLSGRLLCRAEC